MPVCSPSVFDRRVLLMLDRPISGGFFRTAKKAPEVVRGSVGIWEISYARLQHPQARTLLPERNNREKSARGETMKATYNASAFVRSVTSALGYDGLRILADRILADRILADRGLANRGSWRRRLPARQVSSGSSAQHGEGCCRCEHNYLHHDLIPYV